MSSIRSPMPYIALPLDAQFLCTIELSTLIVMSWFQNEALFVFVAGQLRCFAFVTTAGKLDYPVT
jgi:hypothetical protein